MKKKPSMKLTGIATLVILLVGALGAPLGFSQAQAANETASAGVSTNVSANATTSMGSTGTSANATAGVQAQASVSTSAPSTQTQASASGNVTAAASADVENLGQQVSSFLKGAIRSEERRVGKECRL